MNLISNFFAYESKILYEREESLFKMAYNAWFETVSLFALKIFFEFVSFTYTLYKLVPLELVTVIQSLVSPFLRPIAVVTTSAGTGSEVDTIGVISNPDTNEKIGIGGMAGMFAKYAIVDPELMKTVPPKFTAYQGFDALFHSLEGYISNKHNIMGDMIQRAAIENIGHYLARAVKDGNDIEAREHVAYANTMSGYSMVVTSCISEHSMEHAMSAYHPELPHGAGLIMLSKEYFVKAHACDGRFVRMAQALGKKDASKPEDFITALLELQKACGVDDLKMSDYGIKKEEAMTLAKNARATMMRLFVRDPQETTDEEIAGIYERAYR